MNWMLGKPSMYLIIWGQKTVLLQLQLPPDIYLATKNIYIMIRIHTHTHTHETFIIGYHHKEWYYFVYFCRDFNASWRNKINQFFVISQSNGFFIYQSAFCTSYLHMCCLWVLHLSVCKRSICVNGVNSRTTLTNNIHLP